MNLVKYAFVTFKSIDSQPHVLEIFRKTFCCGLCKRIRISKKTQFYGSDLKVETTCDPEFIEWENLKIPKRSKFNRRLVSGMVTLIVATVAFFGLAGFNYFVEKKKEGMNQVVDSDAKFWGEISLVAQSVLLAMTNMLFEVLMEFFTLYEKWDLVPVFYERLFTRLLNLEFFCVALITPVIISFYREDEVVFGVIGEDKVADPND